MNLSRVFNAISEDPDTGWFGHLTNGMRADWYIVVLPGHDASVRCKLCSSEQTPGFAFAGHLEGGRSSRVGLGHLSCQDLRVVRHHSRGGG
jgi:hypothetical protein